MHLRLAFLLLAALPPLVAHAGEGVLTDVERRWIAASMPVLRYAQLRQLPIDVVVQPQRTPGKSPLAMAFVAGRCKFVLSMRGNPQTDAALDLAEPELFDAVIESMAAHEIGHCWRHVNGAWHALPAGFGRVPAQRSNGEASDLEDLRRQMEATRREEAYADLVGLAWTLRHRPQQYAGVHAWLERERSRNLIPGGHHDTRAWIALARDGAAFDDRIESLFEQAERLWRSGFESD